MSTTHHTQNTLEDIACESPALLERIGADYIRMSAKERRVSEGDSVAAFKAATMDVQIQTILGLQRVSPLACCIEALLCSDLPLEPPGIPIPPGYGFSSVAADGPSAGDAPDGAHDDEGESESESESPSAGGIEKKATDLAELLRTTLGALASRDEEFSNLLKKYVDDKVSAAIVNLPVPETVSNKPRRVIIEVVRHGKPAEMLDEIFHPAFPLILALAQARIPQYLVGPTATGKTTIAGQVARVLEMECYPMSLNSLMSPAALMGFVPVTGQGYYSSPFRAAYENGGVCLLDEMDAGNANILTGINMGTSNGTCPFPDGAVEKHENFVLMAGANTFGKGASRSYVGRNVLDAATLDRFGFVEVDYDEHFEESLLTGVNTVVPADIYTEEGKRGSRTFDAMKWLERVRKVRATIEKLDVRMVLSPRVTLFGSKLLGMGIKQEVVENTLIWWKMDKNTRDRVRKAVAA